MNNKLFGMILCFFLVFSAMSVAAAESHDAELEEGKALVEADVDCADLNDQQRKAIGEYVMEVMHPGNAHDVMHQMMGIEEGTEEHELFHIALAQRMYCGSSGYGYGMGMMYGGMMRSGYGMMGSWQDSNYAYTCMNGYCSTASWSVASSLYLLFLVTLVVLAVLLIIKLWRNLYGKKRKK